MASQLLLPLAVWQAGTNQNSIPANDNALRVEVLMGRALGTLSAPPSSPAARAQYVVGASPTGAWAGFAAGDVAIYIDGTWYGWQAFEGWIKSVGDAAARFDGEQWVELAGGGGGAADRSTVTALSISSGAVTIDCALGDYFTLALSANVTSITLANAPAAGKGASLMVEITQGSTPRTVALPGGWKWEGAAPSVSSAANAVDLLAVTFFGASAHATLSKGRA